MSLEEQEKLRTHYYNEAMRYMSNAKENLQKAGKYGNLYADPKYVQTACGVAYNAVLKALDGFLYSKGVEKRKGRKSIEYYYEHLGKLDRSMLKVMHNVYNILHLDGYYDGIVTVNTLQAGMKDAHWLINKIKPQH